MNQACQVGKESKGEKWCEGGGGGKVGKESEGEK